MPTFELRHTDELKAWLIKELEPICDADPEVLSDYVLALLKHDASDSDLQATLQEQLEDFLAEQTAEFVSKTLTALRSQTYLPVAKRSINAANAAGSISSSDLKASAGTSRKRSADDEGRQSPAKTFREIDGHDSGARRGREFEARERRDTVEDENNQQQYSQQRGNGRRSDGPPRQKPMCRDFHQRGYCARGDLCKFDHSLPNMPTAVPSGTTGADGMFNSPAMMGAGSTSHAGPAHQQQYGGGIARHGANSPFMGVGQHVAAMQAVSGSGWGAQPNFGAISGQHGGEGFAGPVSDIANGSPSANGDGGDLANRMGGHAVPSMRGDYGHRGGRGGTMGGMRGGRGGASRGLFEKRPTSNTTLVIENVPQEHLELVKVNEYFKKFGTITNIQIDVEGKKALVSYSQPAEAKAAHSSPEVIFGNRFVKVYFQKLDDPFSRPKEVLTATPTVVHPPPKSNFVPGQTSNKFVRPSPVQERARGEQESAQKKLDELMSEQKEIMTKLTGGSATAEEKKAAMARFGPLEKEIKQAAEELRAAVASVAAERDSSASSSVQLKDQREQKEREQLDRELEAIKTGSSSENAGNTTEELKATLARLQAEAAQLGIDSIDSAAGGGRGGFRGRARAAYRGTARGGYSAFYRGRGAGGGGSGASSRASMSLDNRTSKLHVTDVPDGAQSELGTKVKAHLMQFGETHSIVDKDDGTFVIHYKVRASGERALRGGGLTVPDVGTVKAQWTSEGAASTGGTATAEIVHDETQQADTAEEFGEGEVGEEEDEGDREEHFRR